MAITPSKAQPNYKEVARPCQEDISTDLVVSKYCTFLDAGKKLVKNDQKLFLELSNSAKKLVKVGIVKKKLGVFLQTFFVN